jgi:hypothetical protein
VSLKPRFWRHADPEAGDTLRAALAAAKGGQWALLPKAESARYLRALMVASLAAAQLPADMQPGRTDGEDRALELGLLAGGIYPSEQSRRAGSIVARTPLLLAPEVVPAFPSFRTVQGGIPAEEGETAFPPLIMAAVYVVAIVASAVAAVWIAHEADEVQDRQLARSEDSRRLMGAQASAIELLAKHAAAEEAAKMRIPWSPAELAVLDSLLGAQRVIIAKREQPLPPPFPGASSFLDDAGNKASSALGLLLPVAAIAAAVVVLK